MIVEELARICQHPDCTFSQTGQCIFNREASTCPDRLASISEIEMDKLDTAGGTVLSAPEEMERFSSSLSLNARDTQKLTRNRYCKVIAILGVPGTGKTASLVSLYLLLAHNKLTGYRFLDSKTVMAFEEISKGARRWNVGKLPEQFTAHTELQEERTAGYLHLRVQRTEDSRNMDLLLTDLPGEWTTSLIDTNRTDRLSFLKSSDRIWITVNAEEIAAPKTRQLTIHRIELLINRIKTFLSGKMPGITIVITHCDKTDSVVKHLEPLQLLATDFSIVAKEIASFSGNDEVQPGLGIKELIEDLSGLRSSIRTEFWPELPIEEVERNMLRFQDNR